MVHNSEETIDLGTYAICCNIEIDLMMVKP